MFIFSVASIKRDQTLLDTQSRCSLNQMICGFVKTSQKQKFDEDVENVAKTINQNVHYVSCLWG